jgi:hypothetical protein
VFTGSSRLGSALTGILAIAIGGALVSTVSVAQNTPIEIDTSATQPGGEPEDFTFGRTGQGEGG